MDDVKHEDIHHPYPDGEEVPPRAELLDGAKHLITGDRNNQYGPPLADFERTAGVLNALGYRKGTENLRPNDVAIIMVSLKLSRLMWMAGKEDTWMDVAGYAGCGWEVTLAERGIEETESA